MSKHILLIPILASLLFLLPLPMRVINSPLPIIIMLTILCVAAIFVSIKEYKKNRPVSLLFAILAIINIPTGNFMFFLVYPLSFPLYFLLGPKNLERICWIIVLLPSTAAFFWYYKTRVYNYGSVALSPDKK